MGFSSIDNSNLDSKWEKFLWQRPFSSILQSKKWGELKLNFGWEYELVCLENEDSIIAGALILYKKLPLKLGYIAYIPRGPILEWTDEKLVDALMQKIITASKKKKAWAIWIEPDLLSADKNLDALLPYGFAPTSRSIQPRQTIAIDISDDELSILNRMKQKTRYNVRLAERKGITIRNGTVDDIETFYSVMLETGARDDFSVHSMEYYSRCLQLFSNKNSIASNYTSHYEQNVALFLAEYAGETVASMLIFKQGKMAWYLYGASSNKHRDKMPAYALQWQAVQWAKSNGCTIYDLWGIPDEEPEFLEKEFLDRDDGLWGVYRFKRGLGGQILKYAGLWEKPLNPFYSFLFQSMNKLLSK